MSRSLKRALGAAAVLTAGLSLSSYLPILPANADTAHKISPPIVDAQAEGRTSEIAVLAGGCFWGVQGVFQHVAGVTSAVSGYDGGERATAHYDMTSRGDTGHAESVKITFDPSKVSYGRILQIFFSVAHDPTELNRQGPDEGTQYRSAIFPQNEEQARIAKAYIGQLNQSHAFSAPIVTSVEPGRTFYPAEDYHQDFLARNPTYPYIVYNDLPKVQALKHEFPEVYRPNPVLVGGPS